MYFPQTALGKAEPDWTAHSFVKSKSLKQQLPEFQSVPAYIGINVIPRHS